jgi:hypothetical protein
MDNEPDGIQPEYDTFGLEHSEDEITVLQVDEEQGFFDYLGKVVIEDEKVVFHEFQDESYHPVFAVYTEPERAENRLYAVSGELIKHADVPDDEIEEFLGHLFIEVNDRVSDT